MDLSARKLPFQGRLGLLFAVTLFHAFFGIATLTMTSTIGDQFYHNVAPPGLSSVDSDQHLGVANPVESAETASNPYTDQVAGRNAFRRISSKSIAQRVLTA